jgi:hypothetical protein
MLGRGLGGAVCFGEGHGTRVADGEWQRLAVVDRLLHRAWIRGGSAYQHPRGGALGDSWESRGTARLRVYGGSWTRVEMTGGVGATWHLRAINQRNGRVTVAHGLPHTEVAS